MSTKTGQAQTLGEALYEAGEYEQAVESLERAVELDAPPYARQLLGLSHIELDQPAAAAEALSRAIDMRPKEIPPYIALAQLYAERGDSEQAIELLE